MANQDHAHHHPQSRIPSLDQSLGLDHNQSLDHVHTQGHRLVPTQGPGLVVPIPGLAQEAALDPGVGPNREAENINHIPDLAHKVLCTRNGGGVRHPSQIESVMLETEMLHKHLDALECLV